jgi:hypothetical protein
VDSEWERWGVVWCGVVVWRGVANQGQSDYNGPFILWAVAADGLEVAGGDGGGDGDGDGW